MPKRKSSEPHPIYSLIAMIILLVFVLLVSGVIKVHGQIPAKINGTWIQDHADVFTPEEETKLLMKVQSTGKNINFAIVTVPTTSGVDVADFTRDLGREYGIGAADGEHRGIIYLIAIDTNKTRLEISRHLEGYITDGQAGTILRSVRPQREARDWYGAAYSVIEQVQALTAAVPEQETAGFVASDQHSTPPSDSGTSLWWLLLVPLALGVLGVGIYAKRRADREEAADDEARRKRWREDMNKKTEDYYSRTMRTRPMRETRRESSYTAPVYVPDPTPYESPASTYTPPAYDPPSIDIDFGGSSDFGGGGASD